MPIPPTRYIDAGPGVPQASASAAMAPSLAMAQMGNTIAQVGERGFQIAEKIRRIDETGKMTTLFANMEEDAAQFSIDLMRRSDTANWPKDWRTRSEKWLKTANESGLSPQAMAEFKNRYTQWNTQRSIGFETQAANKSLEMAHAGISNALDYHMAHENWEQSDQVVRDAEDAGIYSPPEAENRKMRIEMAKVESELRQAVEENPGAIAKAKDADLRAEFPGSTPEMIRYAKQEAAKHDSRIAADTARSITDSIYSDKPMRPDELDTDPRIQSLKESGHNKLAESLKRELGARYDDKIQAMRRTPAYQTRIMSMLNKDIGEIDANDELAVFKTENLLRQLESGPMKNHLASELSRRIKGEPDDFSPVGLNLKTIDSAFKNGFFNAAKPEPPADLDQLINDGFLSESNLAAAGLDKKQIKKVLEGEDKDKQTNARKLHALRNIWQNRSDKEAIRKLEADDPFKAATVRAILSNKGTVDYKSPETMGRESAAQWSAAASWATTKQQLLEWAKANPKQAEDIEKVRAELLRLIGPTRSDDFIETTFGAGLMDGSLFFDPLPEPTDLPYFDD